MSDDDVHPDEMDTPDDFDDAATHALFSGGGRGIDPQLADVVADMRMAYVSKPPVAGAELSALMIGSVPVPAPASPTARRSERMRSSIMAKVGVATAALFAATGGLAVAHALPAPVQDAVSHVGVGSPAHHSNKHSAISRENAAEDSTTTTVDSTTTVPDATIVPGVTTPTTTEARDNHGAAVSEVAHEKGCDHGAVVSNVASDGKSRNEPDTAAEGNDANGKCVTTTTIPGVTTTTTKPTDANDGEGDVGHGTPPNSVDPASHSQKGDHGTGNGNGSDTNRGGDSGNRGSGDN
jgi:hypothetical protein